MNEMININPLFTAFLLVFISIAVNAGEVKVEIVDYGVYEYEVLRNEKSNNVSSGKVKVTKKIKLKEKTHNIQTSIGTFFGMRYKLYGLPEIKSAIIKRVTIYPSVGLLNPNDKTRYFTSKTVRELEMGKVYSDGYGFDDEWELVSGNWVIQLWYEGKLLSEVTFNAQKK